jgi:hypothetical protein
MRREDSLIKEIGRTRIEVVLVSLIVDENAGLHERLEHLRKKVLPNVSHGGKVIE